LLGIASVVSQKLSPLPGELPEKEETMHPDAAASPNPQSHIHLQWF